MSVNWGYACTSHDPAIRSERWFNHGEELLIGIYTLHKMGIWPNVKQEFFDDEPVEVNVPGFPVTNSPIVWLREHPNCTVVLQNEYGDRKPIPAQVPPDFEYGVFMEQIKSLIRLVNIIDEIKGKLA